MLKKVTRGIKSLLQMCDLFAISQFIRYKGESDFKTATGGFCSVAILIIFAVLFTSVAIKTLDKKIISWTSQTTSEMEPSPTTFSVSPSPFLFTIGIMYLNLNDPNIRYFDITLTENIWINGVQSIRNVPLVPCTQDHYAVTQQLRRSFKNANANTRLCPPLGQQFTLTGKFTSKKLSYIQITVSKCNPLLNVSRICASNATMNYLQAKMGQFILSQFFINPLLNPGNENYLDYYMEQRNYIAFTSRLGTYSTAHVEDYTIITDQSILPYAVPTEDTGVIITDKFSNINFEVTSDVLAQIFYYKSSTSTTYNRQFYKLDEFFSYVGGLIGVIMGAMLLLSSFNQDSFEFSLAKNLCKGEQGEDSAYTRFNIIYYIMLTFHSIFKALSGKCKKWESISKFQQVKQEMTKQLDISLIIRRIIFLERSVQSLFERGQFQAMHLTEKPTLQKVKKLRTYYRIKRKFNTSKPNSDLPLGFNQSESNLNLRNDIQPQGQMLEQSSSSDSDGTDEQLTKGIKMSLKDFQGSVLAGNQTSLKISKEIKWKDLQLDVGNSNREVIGKDIQQGRQEIINFEEDAQTPEINLQGLKITKRRDKLVAIQQKST